MAVLKRADVPQVELRTETVTLKSLGAEVIVRGRMLAETMALSGLQATSAKPRDGESAEDAQVRAGADIVAFTLANQVVLEDGEPMWSARQWSVHGAAHPNEVVELHGIAQRLSGVGEDVEKN